MLSLNARGYASVARVDKVRFSFPGMESDRAQFYYQRFINLACEHLGWSEEYARRHIKKSGYYHSKDVNGYTFQLTYRAATLIDYISFSWANHLTEMEVKAYLKPKDGKMTNYYWFVDAVYSAPGALNTYTINNGARTSAKKSGASRSVKVGNNKSSTQTGVYARRGERPGLETSVKRTRLRRAVTDVHVTASDSPSPSSDVEKWATLVRRVAAVGFAEFEKELSRRGIELHDYFSHFTDGASPNGDDEIVEVPIFPNGTLIAQQELPL